MTELPKTMKWINKILSEMWSKDMIDDFISIIFQDLTGPLEGDYTWDSVEGVTLDYVSSDQDLLDDAASLGLVTDDVNTARDFALRKLEENFTDKLEEEALETKYQWELAHKPERYAPRRKGL